MKKIELLNNDLMINGLSVDQLNDDSYELLLFPNFPPTVTMNYFRKTNLTKDISKIFDKYSTNMIYVLCPNKADEVNDFCKDICHRYLPYILHVNTNANFFSKYNLKNCLLNNDELKFNRYETVPMNLREKIEEISYNNIIKPVLDKYEGNFKIKVQSMHEKTIKKTIEHQPFILTFQHNNLIGFFSWIHAKILPSIEGIISTHWIDSNINLNIKKNIHEKSFRILNEFNSPCFASIHWKNKDSLFFFRKNNYKNILIRLYRI
jgi:hypothetical protein